ncbi:glycosyltransferase family 4 protein [Candidatus Saccharibacteria bacterium]|nr:glycosyltransferase family 4 protein [Candidatus Saccharibacteria bacterium]
MVKNKTIIFFNGVYLPHVGGVERYTYELAKRLSKDYKVYIVTSNTDNLPGYCEEDGIGVFRLPVRKLPQKNRLPFLRKDSEYRKLLKKIKNLNPVHIICNTRFYETTFLGLRIAKEKGIKPIIIDHSGGYTLKAYEDLTIKKIKTYQPVFYSVSAASKRWLEKQYNISSSGIFYNSVDSKKDFRKPKNKTLRILFAGRLVKTKGIIPLLEVCNRLKKHYRIELIVVGDGPLLKTLKVQFKDATFMGALNHDDTLAEFEKADIFVCPSLASEGFPTSILEAGINKCAIIATDWPGIREMIETEENGILIDREAKALKDSLELLITNSKKRKELQENIFQQVNKKFTWSRTVTKVKKELMRYEEH